MSVDIRPGVLGFTSLEEDIGSNLVNLTDELEQGVIRKMLQGEFSLGSVTRILKRKLDKGYESKDNSAYGFTEDSVSVSRNDLSALQSRPNVLLNLFVGDIIADLGLHFPQPEEYFLVRKTTNCH